MADSGYPSPSSPSPGMTDTTITTTTTANTTTTTEEQVNTTLTQLENVWDDLGLNEEERTNRKRIFNEHIANLLEKILMDERALKSRIIKRIEDNTFKIVKLCEELILEPEEGVDGLKLLDLDAVLQERVDKLHQTKAERLETLRNLQEKDEGLCELLSEEPYYLPSGHVPSLEEIKAVEEHIKAMEKEKDERECLYRKLKGGLLSFLEQLEQTPQDTFTREVVCSDDEDIALDHTTLQRLKAVHSDLEFQMKENMAKSLDLRERINSLWSLLEVSYEDQQAFLSTAPGHTPSNIAKLEAEMERLRQLRLHNLSVFVDKLRKELGQWWEKCYVGEEEKERINIITSDEIGEDVLLLLEGEVERWKTYYSENQELLSAVDNFQTLFKRMLELEDRAKDPSRLFNTRGGTLLQEEKAKRKVKNELPRIQDKLLSLAAAWEKKNGCAFLVYGEEVMGYLDHLWEKHERKIEEEKAKRHVQGKEGKAKGAVMPTQAKTPVVGSGGGGGGGGRKRGMEGEEQVASKRVKQHLAPPQQLPPLTTKAKSPHKRSPMKTPRGKPLSDLNHRGTTPHHPPLPHHHPTTTTTTAAAPVEVLESNQSIQSITYDKFKDNLQSSEGLNSTTLEQGHRGTATTATTAYNNNNIKSLF